MVFLVDDDPIQNMLTSKLIETVGMDIAYKVYQNGEEALDAINQGEKPKLILLDINMPIMDGWEFLEAYRDHKNPATVIMLSSSNMPEDRNRTNEFEFVHDYYLKPITTEDIRKILRKYF